MNLLNQLLANKGTVSSALSKQLAIDSLAGDLSILEEAIKLVHHESKSVRSGAAKIIEKVAEEKPELVAPHLPDLIPCLDYEEPQAKWMMIHIFGLCAKLQPDMSRDIFETVKKYLEPIHGTCLRDRSIVYFGYMGSISKADCDRSFPILIESFRNHPDRITRIFESLERLTNWFDKGQNKTVKELADKYSDSKSTEIKKWTRKISKKLVCFFLFIFYCCTTLSQSKGIGFWSGTMTRQGSEMNVIFEFKQNKDQLSGYFNSPMQKAMGIPFDKVLKTKDSLTFQLMSEPVTYFKLKIYDDSISGYFSQEGFSSEYLSLKKTKPPTKNFIAIDTSFSSGDIRIACKVFIPEGKGKFPGLIFMHGSGGEGMFANQYFAEYLASKGIVTLIQDKRGVGKSTGDWKTSSFNDLANDHLNALSFLKKFNKVNQKQIGVYGHSQGGTIAPLVVSKSKEIAFVIAAAGVGDTVYKQDLYRTENDLKSNGFGIQDIKAAMDYFKSWVDIARNGTGFEKLDSLNKVGKDKKWLDWVEAPPKDHWLWKFYHNIGNYNSLDYWKLLHIPVLLAYGEKDQIEDIHEYVQKIDFALIDLAQNKDVTQIILPKAQHNLCISPEKNERFFWWHISPGYTDLVAGWILYRFKN